MENNVDENLIEATIRRVAAQKAALNGSDDDQSDGAAPPAPSAAAREDHIEETIRRVAAQKAALAAAAPPPASAVAASEAEDPIEATIRRVAAQKAALEAEATEPETPAVVASAPVEEDPIEATIRRVAAQKAARDAGDEEPEPAPAAETPRPSLRQFAPPSHYEPGPPPADSPWSQRNAPGASEGEAASTSEARPSMDAEALERIERKLDETIRTIVHIAARVDALAAHAGNTPASIAAHREAQARGDDDWDDTPVIPRLSGMPPRPSVFRDPSPMTATAEHLQPEVDNRPLPKPLPPIHADPPRRGLDLLPRTYRVTVEDKRRGVDLVPLHRALLGMDGVKDMSLLSYNNGVAIVALDTTNDLDPDALGSCISRAMSREAKVEVHNEHTMVVKLAED